MSALVISGDTSGTITLQAPAVSGTAVLDLPATASNANLTDVYSFTINKTASATFMVLASQTKFA